MKTGIAVVLALLFFGGCTSMVFHPDREHYATPKNYAVAYKSVTFRSGDGTRLVGWWMKPPEQRRGTIVAVHGNAQNMTAHFTNFLWLVKAGYEVFVFDYRGYGDSGGEAQLRGAIDDTKAAIGYVLAHRGGNITVLGQSLGGVLLIDALAEIPADRIALAVIDSAFASLPEAGKDVLARSAFTWPFQWLAYLLLDGRYDAVDRVGALHVRKLYLAGSNDRTVDPNQSWRLFDASAKPRAFWLVQGAGHTQAFASRVVRRKLLAFLEAPDFSDDFSTMLIFDKITFKKGKR